MIHVSELIRQNQQINIPSIANLAVAVRGGAQIATEKPLTFMDLLMTFSFDLKNITDFCGFGCSMVQKLIEKVNSGYSYPYVTIDQLLITPQNELQIDDLGEDIRLSQYLLAPESYFPVINEQSAKMK